MELGHFSLSLNVKDITASKSFYQAMGFIEIDGSANNQDYELPAGQDWAIMKNEGTVIGLFQGMFESNILTFHPKDARSIQKSLKESGIGIKVEADESETGPAYVMLTDPDGNEIMFDQP